jgi:hypothetical protein
MPVFRVTSPDGSAYDVTAPDGASEQDALAIAQAHHNALTQLASAGTNNAGGGDTQTALAANASAPLSVNNVARTLARGVPVAGAYLDELDAATNAAISPLIPSWLADAIPGDTWKQRYLASLATQRREDQAFDAAHPLASLGLRFGGGAAAGAAAMLGAPTAARLAFGMWGSPGSRLETAGHGLASGAVLSGLHGFGDGEGDFKSRLANAGYSAAFGGLLGAAVPQIAHSSARDIANYLGSDATAQPAEDAGNTALAGGSASIPPLSLLHLLTGALGGANPTISARRRSNGQ